MAQRFAAHCTSVHYLLGEHGVKEPKSVRFFFHVFPGRVKEKTVHNDLCVLGCWGFTSLARCRAWKVLRFLVPCQNAV